MQNFGRQPIITDTSRMLRVESNAEVYGEEFPGFSVVEWCPVREATEGNGYEIWPPVYDTVEEAAEAIAEYYAAQ